jgi:hypothetical protein
MHVHTKRFAHAYSSVFVCVAVVNKLAVLLLSLRRLQHRMQYCIASELNQRVSQAA